MPQKRDHLLGRRFGKLLVIGFAYKRGKQLFWFCRCDCGQEKAIWRGCLAYGKSRSCGRCFRGESLVGRRFGRLLVETPGESRAGKRYWNCLCDCGVRLPVSGWGLRSGRAKSCGCQKIAKAQARARLVPEVGQVRGRARITGVSRFLVDLECLGCGATGSIIRRNLRAGARARVAGCGCAGLKHGHFKSRVMTPPYSSWASMRKRVRKAVKGYEGVRICARWDSFQNFLEDLGWPPGPGYSLDRKSPWGNYSCGKCEECLAEGWEANCRWATKSEQTRNRRPHFVNRKVGPYFWKPSLDFSAETSQN